MLLLQFLYRIGFQLRVKAYSFTLKEPIYRIIFNPLLKRFNLQLSMLSSLV